MKDVIQQEKTTVDEVGNSALKLFLAAVAQWLNKHWILKTIIQFLPSIWAPVFMTGLGDILMLKKPNGLTQVGWFGVCFIFSLSLFVSILSNFKIKRDIKKAEYFNSIINAKESDICLYNAVSDGERQSENSRLERLIAETNLNDKNLPSIGAFINNSFSPRDHLQNIASEIKHCFEQVTQMRRSDFYISMAASIDGNRWEWINQVEIAGCASITELLSSDSTFRKIYNGEKTFVYYNDKNDAHNNNNYYMDKKDKNYGGKGSIICWEISLYKNNEPLARLILSISTYGKCFTNKEELVDTMYEEKIKKIILDQFENEIKFDLFLYYIQAHNLKQAEDFKTSLTVVK